MLILVFFLPSSNFPGGAIFYAAFCLYSPKHTSCKVCKIHFFRQICLAFEKNVLNLQPQNYTRLIVAPHPQKESI